MTDPTNLAGTFPPTVDEQALPPYAARATPGTQVAAHLPMGREPST